MATKKNVPAAPAGTAVANWQDQLAKEAAAAASTESVGSELVSFKSGVLTFNGQAIGGNQKDFIVLDSAYEHAFYGDMVDGNPVGWAYDADNPKSPSCWAVGRVESDLMPNEEKVEALVNAECVNCPLNEWGSDPEGGKGKAYKNVRRVALLDASLLEADDPELLMKAPVYYAKLPVTSGKLYSAYVIQIANVTKRPPHGVISKLKVVPDARTQFQVQWEFVDNIPDHLVPAIMARREKLADGIMFDYPKNEEREQQAPQRPAPRGNVKHAVAGKGKK